jgi:hypothetical protein
VTDFWQRASLQGVPLIMVLSLLSLVVSTNKMNDKSTLFTFLVCVRVVAMATSRDPCQFWEQNTSGKRIYCKWSSGKWCILHCFVVKISINFSPSYPPRNYDTILLTPFRSVYNATLYIYSN